MKWLIVTSSGHRGQSGQSGPSVVLVVVKASSQELVHVLLRHVTAMTSNGPLVIPCRVTVCLPLSLSLSVCLSYCVALFYQNFMCAKLHT